MADPQHHACAYVFVTDRDALAIAWSGAEDLIPLRLAPGVQALDIMGNGIGTANLALSPTPLHLNASGAEALIESIPSK